jgi:DNA-binding transcriptional LysR family regulator
MLNPQHLANFAAIVQAGSISHAAKAQGCGKSVVSRQLARLEADLGSRLIQRSTRRLALTEIGELVLQQALQIERALANIAQMTDQHQQQVQGQLRVSCSMAGRGKVVPLLAEFVTLYPQVNVVLQLEDNLVDLIAQQIDVAIRASHLADSSLIARKLTDNPNVLVAAPAYLARAGTPRTPQDLRGHACLVYASGGRASNEWTFGGPDGAQKVRVEGPLQINDGSALVTAACIGMGVLLIGRFLVGRELARGELVELMPDYRPQSGLPIYAVYPARDWLALKTATFIGFMQERFGGNDGVG